MNEQSGYPEAFKLRMRAVLKDDYNNFMASLDSPAPTSIRLNPTKPSESFINNEAIPWCAGGRYLSERPSFTFDPLFHAGAYYVQEASSMFLEEIWKQIDLTSTPVKVLDLCAAPGGKSTHLLSSMNSDSLLVTNEIIAPRNKTLQQNIIKWGYPNCIITQNKAEDFASLGPYFNVVLVDAPCSGEGLFRKDKDAITEWSEKNVAMCSTRQKDILKDALQCLLPGGYLVYSTCTFEPDENDNHIAWLLENGLTKVELKKAAKYTGVQATTHGWQFFPHKVKGEGFYVSVLRKEPDGEERLRSNKKPIGNTTDKSSSLISGYLQSPEKFIELKRNNIIFAIPVTIADDFMFLEKKLYIRSAGIELGEMKGHDFLPSAALALSNCILSNLPSVELSYDEAITYLRCEAPIFKSTDRGWHLAKHKGLNLGWLKLLGNRANNYYPKEWRILKR